MKDVKHHLIWLPHRLYVCVIRIGIPVNDPYSCRELSEGNMAVKQLRFLKIILKLWYLPVDFYMLMLMTYVYLQQVMYGQDKH